jgi:tetratricopeptide (TPR) repeat protein
MAVGWVRCAVVSILLAIALSFFGGAYGQSDDIEALNQRISKLRGGGNYSEAIPLAERSLELTRGQKVEDHPDTAPRMSWLAVLYGAQDRYAEAEPLLKRAPAIFEKTRGPDHRDVGTPLNNLAGLYRDQGRHAEAEPLLKRALAISEKALGPDDPAIGTVRTIGVARAFFHAGARALLVSHWRVDSLSAVWLISTAMESCVQIPISDAPRSCAAPWPS